MKKILVLFFGLHASFAWSNSQAILLALYELEQIVLRHQLINSELEDDMVKRAKKSVLVPTISLFGDFGHQLGSTEKKIVNNTNDTLFERGERDFGAGIKLTFNLGDLIYNNIELELKKLAVKHIDKRQQIIQNVHKNYFKYVRLKTTLAAGLKDGRDSVLKLELLETEAVLNSLSGGAFSNMPALHL